MYPVVFDDQTTAAIVGQADADAGVFQGTGDADIRPAVIVRLFDGIQRFAKPVDGSAIWPLGRTSPGRIAL